MGKSQIIAAVLALVVFPSAAFAGAANANLNCQSSNAGSAVLLSGSIPGDLAEFEVSLQYKGQSLVAQSEEDRINVVNAVSEGVFVVTVALANGDNLQLYALPKSISHTGSHSTGKLKASFKAILSDAPKPFWPTLNGTEFICSYVYAI